MFRASLLENVYFYAIRCFIISNQFSGFPGTVMNCTGDEHTMLPTIKDLYYKEMTLM